MTFNASFVLHVHQGKHMYHCGGTLLYISRFQNFSLIRLPYPLRLRSEDFEGTGVVSYIYHYGSVLIFT